MEGTLAPRRAMGKSNLPRERKWEDLEQLGLSKVR